VRKLRVACKVFYLGDNYRGFQYQKDVDTVEGRIKKALNETKLIENESSSKFQAASRTDALVHALGNVIAFNTDQRVIIPQINHNLPNDIIIWAKKKVENDFSPRFNAIKRHYKYITHYFDENLNKMQEEAKKFVGIHNFINFSKKGEYKNTQREIFKINIAQKNNFLIFDIIGNAFLYQMVRRIVNFLLKIGKGKIFEKEVEYYLNTELEASKRIKPAPLKNEGVLILWDVIFPFEFEIDSYSFKKLKILIQSLFQFHSLKLETMKFFSNFLDV